MKTKTSKKGSSHKSSPIKSTRLLIQKTSKRRSSSKIQKPLIEASGVSKTRPGKKFQIREIRDDLNPKIFNRRYFKERLKEEILRFNRHKRPLSLIVADVDHFKKVNDTHRHLVGDQTLTTVSQVIKESVRDFDVVCRYGGDEFVIILPEADENESKTIAERIRCGISEYPWEKDHPFKILSMSLGVATYEKEEGVNQFFDKTDKALYLAKKRGRNQIISMESLSKDEGPGECPRMDLSTPILVGREGETLLLEKSFEKVLEGHGSLLLIGGEAGVGKTRLVSSVERFPRFSQAFYLKGACHVETRTIPYYPFIEAFSGFFNSWGRDQKEIYREIREIYRRELARIIPKFEEREPVGMGTDAPPDRFRLFEGVHLLMETLSRKKPLILFLDDLHWADETSLDLLHYISRRIGRERVLIIGTYREEELSNSPLSKTIPSMAAERLMEKIVLPSLSGDTVSTLIDSAFPGAKFNSAFKNLLTMKTDGNPFFVMEILRSLGEEDRIKILREENPPDFYESLILPESVKETIHRRMEELDPEIREILTLCAILGKEFPFDLLLHLSGKNEGNLLGILDKTVEHYLLEEIPGTEGDRYRFHHALTADAMHSTIQGKRRKLLHRQAGKVIEEYYHENLDEVSGDLARHYYNGEDYPKAFLYARKAGDRAKRIYANREAIDYYTKSLDALDWMEGDNQGDRFDLLLNRSEILGLAGRRKEQKRDIEKAIDFASVIKDRKRLSDAYINHSYYYLQTSDFPKSLKSAEKALGIKREITDRAGEAKALQRIGSVSTDMGDTARAIQCHEEALKICKKIGDRIGEGTNLFSIGVTHYFTGDLKKALKFYQDSLKIFQEEGDKWREGITLGNMGVIHSQMGDDQKALEYYQESLKIRRVLGDRAGEMDDLLNIGNVFLDSGTYPKALEYYQESAKICKETGNKTSEANGLGNMGRVYTLMGDYAKAIEYLEKTWQIRKETEDRRGEVSYLNKIGDVYENLGEYEKAIQFLNKALLLGQELNSKVMKIDSLNSLSSVYRKKGGEKNIDLAILYAREETELSQNASLPYGEIEGLSNQAIAYLLQGYPARALNCSEKAISLLEKQTQKEDLKERIYFNHYKVLLENNDDGNAKVFLERAYEEVMKKAKWINDQEIRKRFLTHVKLNREIVETLKMLKKISTRRR